MDKATKDILKTKQWHAANERAKKVKNDEFYTLYEEIETELENYKSQLKGKRIYLPCDRVPLPANITMFEELENKTKGVTAFHKGGGIASNFWNYLHKNFAKLELKELVATNYLANAKSYKATYKGSDDPNCEKFEYESLENDGDFRNDTQKATALNADIIITNPPFSLIRDFLDFLKNAQAKFLIVVPLTILSMPSVFQKLKSKEWKVGINSLSNFLVCNEITGELVINEKNEPLKKSNNCFWLTNLDIWKERPFLKLPETYDENRYQKYDNYDAINCDNINEIPRDYTNEIGVPITYLLKWNPRQFELVNNVNRPVINGEQKYKRITIRNLRPSKPTNTRESAVFSSFEPFHRLFKVDIAESVYICACAYTVEDDEKMTAHLKKERGK